MNSREVALFWIWMGTKCVCVNRGPACSLTAPLHPLKADTHMHRHRLGNVVSQQGQGSLLKERKAGGKSAL